MKTIDILGYGESLKFYKPSGNETFGVNRIFDYYPVNNLVVTDRYCNCEIHKKIAASKPDIFYSPCPTWSFMNNYKYVEHENKTDHFPDLLDPVRVPRTVVSIFMATVLAFHHKADRIILYGADFNQDYGSHKFIDYILLDYSRLKICLDQKRVELFVNSKISQLAKVLPVLKSS